MYHYELEAETEDRGACKKDLKEMGARVEAMEEEGEEM